MTTKGWQGLKLDTKFYMTQIDSIDAKNKKGFMIGKWSAKTFWEIWRSSGKKDILQSLQFNSLWACNFSKKTDIIMDASRKYCATFKAANLMIRTSVSGCLCSHVDKLNERVNVVEKQSTVTIWLNKLAPSYIHYLSSTENCYSFFVSSISVLKLYWMYPCSKKRCRVNSREKNFVEWIKDPIFLETVLAIEIM